MFNYDFLDYEDTPINNSVKDAKASDFSISSLLDKTVSKFKYDSFYDAPGVTMLPSPTINYNSYRVVNPFKSRRNHHRVLMLRVRRSRRIQELRARTNEYYKTRNTAK